MVPKMVDASGLGSAPGRPFASRRFFATIRQPAFALRDKHAREAKG
jgi:hypothetical protein